MVGGKRNPVLGEKGYQQKRRNGNGKGGEEKRDETTEEGPPRDRQRVRCTFPCGTSNKKIPLQVFFFFEV